jgi:hypothetical protein
VPCGSAALAGAIGTANATPSLLRLAPFCTYLITTALPQVTVAIAGGPFHSRGQRHKRAHGQPGRRRDSQ